MPRKFAQMCPRCCCMLMFTFAVCLCPFIAFCRGILPQPVGLYPLNNFYKTADASCFGNLDGTAKDTKLVTGPFGQTGTAYEFAGIGTSYISIPHSQHLDSKNSITILVWIFQSGRAGSIIQYNNRGMEPHTSRSASVELRTSKTNSIHAQFVERNGKLISYLTNDTVSLNNKWHYVGASYDHNRGTATLWIDGKDVQHINLGKLELSTDRDIQIGGGRGKGDSFQGKISCIQIYDRALTRDEVTAVRDRCFKDGQPPVDCRKTSAPSRCGVFMNTLSGAFSSPGYPAGYPYEANCVWEIEVPSGHFITLKFGKFDLEESFSTWPDCPDHVVIRDGTNSWSKKLKTLCGGQSDWEDEIESSGNGMRVEFRTNKDHSAAGFFAKYTTSLLHDEKEEDEEMMDFSRHYTGIVIGVACAAIFAILSIITFSHTRRRLRERRHGSLTRSHRHSVSFSDNDVFQQNAPPTYDDVMRYPELYPPTPCQGSLANTPAATPRRGSPVSTPTIPHRLLIRPGSPALVPKVGTPVGMPVLNIRRGISTPHSTSRVSLQRGISPLARTELTPQLSRQADHVSSDAEHDDDDDDDELPPYPGIVNVDSVLDQVRETLEHSRFATRQSSNPSLSDSNSSDGDQCRTANTQRGSHASCTVRDNAGVIQTRLEANRNSVTSVQSLGRVAHGQDNPWVPSKFPRMGTSTGNVRSIESEV